MKKIKKVKLGKFKPEYPPPMGWLKWIVIGYLCIFAWVIFLTYMTGK